MASCNMDPENGISIRWVRLVALDAVPVTHGSSLITRYLSSPRLVDSRSCLSSSWISRVRSCNWNRGTNALASLSSIFSRIGTKKRTTANASAGKEAVQVVAFIPLRGTYAYDVLQRRFKELDKDGSGYLSEGDLKVALKKLNLPASEEEVQSFMMEVMDTTGTSKITFEKFSEYAVHQENQLVDTFKELDKTKTGYITVDELKGAFRRYKFRSADKDIEKLANKLHRKGGAVGSLGLNHRSQLLDFSEYRGFLMLSTFKDLRDIFQIWGRAMVDLGDVDMSFPLSSGRHSKKGRVGYHRSKQRILQHLLSGCISAAVSRTVVAPLECCKILSMVNSNNTRKGFTLAISDLWSKDGFRALYRGNFLNVLQIAPTKIVEFVVYDKLKELLLKRTQKVDLSRLERVALGSLALMAGTLIIHPVDTLRTLFTVHAAGSQNGVIECSKSILHNSGFPGFYRGILPNMMRVAPYGAINFVVYDQLKHFYRKRIGPGGDIGVIPTVGCGVIAGAIAQTAVYPLETLQRRLQAQAAQQLPVFYKNMIDAFQITIQQEGIKALYAGILPNYVKLVPAAAVSLLVYEAVKDKLDMYTE